MQPSTEPLAYFNGRLVPLAQASVPVWDAGFILGATVAEQLRTFSGRLFRLDAHLERLAHSLELVGVDPGVSLAELGKSAADLAAHNHRLLAAGDDLNLVMFVTPGPYPTMAAAAAVRGPTVCMHTFPLPFHLWSEQYTAGTAVVTTSVRQVPAESWPRELKCRSRMHYYLADREARSIDPAARALIVDSDGFLTETTTANIVIYRPDEGLVGPPRAKVLPGISLATLVDLAAHEGIAYRERDLAPADLAAADEVLLTGTSLCVASVVRFNGQPIGAGRPGPIQRALLAAWSRLVGVDIAAQASLFSARP